MFFEAGCFNSLMSGISQLSYAEVEFSLLEVVRMASIYECVRDSALEELRYHPAP